MRRHLLLATSALVVLIGVSGSGKSRFAARHFRPTEVLSSDAFRAWVAEEVTSLHALTRERAPVLIDASGPDHLGLKP